MEQGYGAFPMVVTLLGYYQTLIYTISQLSSLTICQRYPILALALCHRPQLVVPCDAQDVRLICDRAAASDIKPCRDVLIAALLWLADVMHDGDMYLQRLSQRDKLIEEQPLPLGVISNAHELQVIQRHQLDATLRHSRYRTQRLKRGDRA